MVLESELELFERTLGPTQAAGFDVTIMSPSCHQYVTKLGNEPKFYEMLSLFDFQSDFTQLWDRVQGFGAADFSAGKLAG